MKVLLLNPPYVPHFIRSARWAAQSISGSNWFPIWLGYCTAWLESLGHDCRLYDALIEGHDPARVLEEAKAFAPDLLVEYVSGESLPSDAKMAEDLVRATGCRVVFVGPWCGADPEGMLRDAPAAEALVEGEFDLAVGRIAQGEDLATIPGVWRRDEHGKALLSAPRVLPSSEELDRIPFVTELYFRHLPVKRYFQAPHLHPFVDLFTGRGCAWGLCTFCLWPQTMGCAKDYRPRSLEKVMEELRFLSREHPEIREIFFQDDTLPDWRAREISQALLDEGLKIRWSCYSRANLDRETLSLMKRAGCRCLHVGFESGCPELLKAMRKGVTVETMERFARDAYEVGLVVHGDFIFGLPGETRETIERSIRWAMRLPIHSYQITTPKAYGNTQLRAVPEAEQCSIPRDELVALTKQAIRRCHLNPAYLWRMAFFPRELYRILRAGFHVAAYVFSDEKRVGQ